MKRELFPIEIVEYTTEELIAKNSIKTHFIYNFVLFAVAIAAIATYFISIDVNVVSSGMLKSPGERFVITSPYSAFVDDFSIEENVKINRGDTIFVLNSEHYSSDLVKNEMRHREITAYIGDLKRLVKVKEFESPEVQVADASQAAGAEMVLQTPLYTQSYRYYHSQYQDLRNRVDNLHRNYERSKGLRQHGDIAVSEFESVESEYHNASYAVNLFFNRQINEWQSELDRYNVEQRELVAQIDMLKLKMQEAVVVSPVSGSVQRIEGVSSGSFVQQGQKIAEISMDSTLLVECMVSPKDIGYLYVGQQARIQVDAFNYNDWGFVEGEIVDIFNDVTIVSTASGDMPYFRVMCSVDRTYMELKSGYRGELGRGMTVNARFVITRRTLFQLLYDKVDDWMNPNA